MPAEYCRPSISQVFNVTVLAPAFISPSNDRTSIIVTTTGADVYLAEDLAATGNHGLRIAQGIQPGELCICHYGQWVRKPLRINVTAGAAVVYVIQGFEPWPRS